MKVQTQIKLAVISKATDALPFFPLFFSSSKNFLLLILVDMPTMNIALYLHFIYYEFHILTGKRL